MNKQKTFVIIICLLVGALHFIIGPNYNGPFKYFVSGYLIDILLPFCVYFLLKLPGIIPKYWMVAAIVVLIGFSVETLQYFDIYVLGSTFDPLDYLMYCIGVLLAFLIDIYFFSKLNPIKKRV